MAVPNPERELERLRQTLGRASPNVVVLCGTSGFFRAEAFDVVQEHVPAGADVRIVDGMEDTDGRELQDLRGGALFGTGNWLLVRRADAWLKRHGEALTESLARIAPGCGLCIETQKLDRRTRLWKAIAAAGEAFEFRDLYAEPYDRTRSLLEAELCGWLAARARTFEVELTLEAAYLVIASVGREPAELLAEVERLRVLWPAGEERGRGRMRIGPEELRAHLSCSFESTPFEFADAVLGHDRRRALRSLHAMYARGVKQKDGGTTDAGGLFPFIVSWLHQSLGTAHEGRRLLDEGVPIDAVAGRVGVRTFIDRFRAQVLDNPEERLRRGLRLLHECQRELRTTGEDPRSLLERFLARYFRAGAA